MKKKLMMILTVLTLAGLGSGCGKAWELEYGDPAAQFLQADVATKASPFMGKQITVKGTVTKVDVSDPKAAWIHLAEGIKCNLRHLNVMAQSCVVGSTVYVDGFLERCEEGDIVMDPAGLRDPTAPFSPM